MFTVALQVESSASKLQHFQHFVYRVLQQRVHFFHCSSNLLNAGFDISLLRRRGGGELVLRFPSFSGQQPANQQQTGLLRAGL